MYVLEPKITRRYMKQHIASNMIELKYMKVALLTVFLCTRQSTSVVIQDVSYMIILGGRIRN